MTKANLLLATALLAFGAAACQQSQPQDNIDDTTANVVEPDASAPAADNAGGSDATTNNSAGNSSGNASDNSATPEPPKAGMIPAAFQGRWGMVPADCTSTRGDAKGLITVADKTIRFYESTATLTKVSMSAPENFVGVFGFTGEGQTWTKTETLKLSNSSKTLTRSDDEGSYKYARCA